MNDTAGARRRAGTPDRAADAEAAGGTFVPLQRRLTAPCTHPASVQRDGLVEQLLHAAEPLVLITAPAGYGKSTLLAQWVAAREGPTSWLQLDTPEDDPLVLLRYLTAALEPVAAVAPALPELLELRAPPVEERILPGLAAAVAAASPFLLVLDDAHLLRNEACWRYLGVLLDHLPDGAHVAIGTRQEPPLPLARLHAAGRLLVLRADDLRMSDTEAEQLLRNLGCVVDGDTVGALVEATEGWPVGLSLAVLAAQTQDACDIARTTAALRRVRGDRRDVAAYLTTEVLDRQPVHLQEFMLRTSILDRFSGPLCSAVTRRDDAGALLARLVREGLFVVALDDHDTWYRYHHLFGDLLLAELDRRDPGQVLRLHRRAAAWYKAHGDGDRAVRHGIAAGDGKAFVDLAARACDDHLCHGRVEAARRLFACVPDDLLRDSPTLQLTAAMLIVNVVDDRAARWARVGLAATIDDAPSPLGGGSLREWQLMYRAALGLDGVKRMREDAAAAYRPAYGGDPSWLCLAARLYARALHLTGASRQAERVLRKTLPVSTYDLNEEAFVLALLILVLADQDRWEEVLELDARLTGLATAQVHGPGLIARARVLAHRGDPELPAYVDRAAREMAANLGSLDYTWLHASTVFAESLLEHGDAEAAETWTARAETILERYPDGGILRGRTTRLREALQRRRMTDPPTPAEQRVLELLPTRLTATQMAARLFLSTNTVKTHMRHLYAKLGVTDRTAAVERSRELGLLRPPGER